MNVLTKTLTLPREMKLDRQILIDSLSPSLRRALIPRRQDGDKFDLSFFFNKYEVMLLIAVQYDGEVVKVDVPNEGGVKGNFQDIRDIFLRVVDLIQRHICNLVEAEIKLQSLTKKR